MGREELKFSVKKDRIVNWTSPKITSLAIEPEDDRFFRQFARNIVESSGVPLFLIESETGIILECSQAVEELLRKPPDAIKGQPFSAICLIPPRADLTPGRSEAVLQRADGTLLPVEVIMSAFRTGKRAYIQSVFLDISDRKQAESLLSETEKSLRHLHKMEAVGTLAGGIAHEFNNILAAIIGYTEMSIQDSRDGTEIQGNLEHIFSAGLRAKDLIRQILTFSRQTEQNLIPVSLNPVLKEAVRMLKATLPKNIEVRQNIRTDAGIVRADPIQIHQVLMNLSTNAVNAMSETGGILTIELSCEALGQNEISHFPELSPGSYLKLTVSDTGCGIAPDIVDRIFDPFFKTDRSGHGSGLGLSVVYGIVKKHGGGISVESRVGSGTSFRVFLPVLKQDSHPGYQHLIQNLPGGNETILFVDDEENLAALAGRILQRLGYHVVTQTSSVDALKRFSSEPDSFDLVITDQGMPQLSGLSLAREMKRIRGNVPIILCTGFNELLLPDNIRSAGIDEFIQKPLVMHEMASVIRKVLDSDR